MNGSLMHMIVEVRTGLVMLGSTTVAGAGRYRIARYTVNGRSRAVVRR